MNNKKRVELVRHSSFIEYLGFVKQLTKAEIYDYAPKSVMYYLGCNALIIMPDQEVKMSQVGRVLQEELNLKAELLGSLSHAYAVLFV